MEDRGQYDILLAKYLASELNAEDEIFIKNWLNSNIENQQNFESLKSTWELLGVRKSWHDVNVDTEWLQLKNNLESDVAKVIYLPQRQIPQTQPVVELFENKNKFRRIYIAVSIAVSVILMFFIGGKFLFNNSVPANEIIKRETVDIPPADPIRNEVNRTGKPVFFKLEDGSTVVLFGKSEIRFKTKFPADRRDIILYGKAQFKVAHDKSKPFTVFSGDIKTTALGTNFTVTAFQDEDRIVVRLNEGKVVVRPVDKSNSGFVKDAILLPGQELTYDKKTKIIKVRTLTTEKKKTINGVVVTDGGKNRPDIPTNYRGSWFMFNNQSLIKIFESLQEMYNTRIIYSEKDLQKLYFIGTFNRTDSLEGILQHIADLNNLTVTKTDSTFIISNR